MAYLQAALCVFYPFVRYFLGCLVNLGLDVEAFPSKNWTVLLDFLPYMSYISPSQAAHVGSMG
jgi:hypothetical protein